MFGGNAWVRVIGVACGLLSQLNQRSTSATLIPRRGDESSDVGMVAEKTGDGATQCAGAVAVNDSHLTQTRERGFVEKLVNGIDGFVRGLSDHVQFRLDLVRRVRQVDFRAGCASQFFEFAWLCFCARLLFDEFEILESLA